MFRKILLIFCIPIILYLFLASSFKDSTDSFVNIPPKTHPKIISLSPYVTEILFNLGCEQDILAVTNYCNRPKEANLKYKIGGMVNPSVEKMLLLKADVVFATREDQSEFQVKKMRSLGMKVFVLKETKNWSDIKDNFLTVAAIVGKSKEAQKAVQGIEQRLDEIKKSQTKLRKVFFVIDTNPVITVSQSSYLNDVLAYVNAENLVKDVAPRYPIYSKEKILALHPEVVVFILPKKSDRSKILNDLELKGNVYDGTLKNMEFIPRPKGTSDVVLSSSLFVDADVFSRANPYAFLEAVQKLAEIFGEFRD